MAKAASLKIKLVSSADTGFYYVTKKNSRTMTDKLVKKKYDPIARKPCLRELGENRRAARDFDELLHPADARDERLVPFLEERPQPPGEPGRRVANAVEATITRPVVASVIVTLPAATSTL